MAKKRKKSEIVAEGRAFFRRVAKEGAYAPVFVFYGEERFLVDQALERVEHAVFPDGRDDFNWSSFQAGQATGKDIAAAAGTIPMFASARLVVVRGAQHLSADDLRAVADYVESPSPSTVLVLEATKLNGRASGAQRILKGSQTEAIEFPSLYERDVAAWIPKQAHRKGLAVARDVPAYLVDAIGTSLQDLDLALDRLALYVGEDEEARKITLEVAQKVLPDTRVRSIFELVDALAEKRLDDAMRFFGRMLEHGDSPIGVTSMIARQFRQVWLTRDGLREGLRDWDLAKHAGVPKFRLGDYERAARRFSDAQLRDIMRRVAATDAALKSSRLPDRVHVDRLFIAVCR